MSELEDTFPRLRISDYWVTSPSTPLYNCIAWAAEDNASWWEPDPMHLAFWPKDVKRERTLQGYAAAFIGLGYETCSDGELETGQEKVALFADPAGRPTHAARQLPDGSWTSKIGKLEDIEHRRLDAVSGTQYGRPVVFLRRPITRRPITR